MQNFLQKMLCRLASARSYLKQWKKCQNMKKITLFIMDVGVLDQRFSLSGYWQGKSLVSRVIRRSPERRVFRLIIDQVIHLLSKKTSMPKMCQFFTFYEFGKKNFKKRKMQERREAASPCSYIFCFFDFFPHKSVKRKKLAHFCHACLFLANVSLRRKN